MGALYEDVENFFGDIFAWYGKLVARFPFIFTIVPLLTCIVFGFGLFNIHYETNIENLYSPINSDAQKDRQLLKTLFDFHYHHHYQSSKNVKSHANSSGHEQQKSSQQNDKKLDFRFHQQINYPAYIEIIIFNKRRKNDSTSTGNSTSNCNNIFSKLSNQSKNDSENCQYISFEDQINIEDSTNVNELFENLTEFSPETWMAVQLLYRSIATQKGPKNPSFNYSNVCAKLGDVCAVDIFELSDDKTACMFPKQSYSTSGPYIKYQPSKSFGKKLTTMKPPRTTTSSDFITSVTPTNRNPTNNPTRYFPPSTGSSQISYLPPLIISTTAKAVKLRFNLRGETHGMGRQKHLRWQDSTLDHLKRFKSSIINIAFVASDSLEIELRDHVGGDTKYFALSVVAMLVSATLAGNGGSLDHVVLAYTGVVAALLAILGAFGLLSLAGASFVNLCSVMPFLVLGIGVDDMLQLLVEWRKTLSQEERLSGTLRSAAVSITITSLTDLLAFCIGATSPFLSVRNFCACSGVGIFLCYVNQLTFFSGCIVLISRQCKRKRNSQKTQKLQTEPNNHPDRKTTADSSTTTTTIAELQEDDDEVSVERPKNKRQDHVTKSSINSDDSRSSNNDPSGSVKVPCTKSTAGSPKGDGMIGRKRDSMFTTLVADVLTSVPIENRHSSEDIIHNETSIAAENNKETDDDVYQIVDCCGRMRSCYERRDGTMERFKSTVRTGICESFSRIFIKYYPKILLHWIGKTVTVIFYIAYVGLSIHGVANLEEGLNLEALVPPEYYYRRHAEIDSRFFPNCGIIVTFFIHQPITYHEFHTQERLQAFMKSVETSEFVSPGSTIFWLEEFLGYLATSDKDKPKKRRMDEVEFARKLQKDFFIKHPEFVGDVVFSKQTKTPSYIEASRLYAVCHRTNSSEWEKDLMLEMRRLANNSSLPMKAFSPHFVFYEHYASIVKNALLPVGVTIIGMLFVALVFIPHPIAVTCVIGSMASVVVGMMGFMQLCGLALSAITTMQIILGVGICVSFTVRTNHAFMTATGKSRNERVTSALTKVGVSILTGAACSVLSASALYYGSSFIFASFFKTTAFALLLGVLHSLVFLPVMLSFVGPRRTSKPRLFIPVTPTSPEPTGSPNCPLIERDRHPSEDSTKSKSSNSSSRKNSNETSSRHPPLCKNRSTSIEQYRDEIDSSSKGSKSQRVSFKLEETNMKEMASSKEKQNEPKQKSMSKAACAQTNF